MRKAIDAIDIERSRPVNPAKRHHRRAGLTVLAAVLVLGPAVAEVPAGAEPSASEPGPATGGSTMAAQPFQDRLSQTGPTRGYLPGLQQFVDDQAVALGDRFAGASAQEDGTAVVALTEGPVPPLLAANPNVRIVTKRFSIPRLNDTMKNVVTRLNTLLNPGVAPGTAKTWPFSGDLLFDENVVDITIDEGRRGEDARIRAALADELAAGTLRLRYGAPAVVTPTSCISREACSTPWRGGTRIDNAYGTGCSSGFVMKAWHGVRYQSTAGHCSPGPWSHNGTQIGFTAWTQTSGNVDARIVHQNNQSQNAPRNLVYYGVSNNALSITSKVVSPGTTWGTSACLLGWVSGGTCGAIKSTNFTVNGLYGLGAHEVPVTCRGDSGGATVQADGNRAYGFSYGATMDYEGAPCGNNTWHYFIWSVNVEAASGFQVLLTPTTETLGPGQRMHGGDSILSTNGMYALNMQTDGNLVLYGPTGLVWATNTVGHAGAFVTMQNAGNLVLYSAANTPLWARPPSGYMAGSRLVVQNDRNVVIYSENGTPTWATGTNI